MIRSLQLALTPAQANDAREIRAQICEATGIDPESLNGFLLRKRSIDARSRFVKIMLSVDVFIDEPVMNKIFSWQPKEVSGKEEVVIIGAGPAGLFAALRLIDLGKKPILLERGKDVRRRRRDLAILNKEMIVDPDSNYCFGEGGAGTYSDGKLYTRSGKRGDINSVLELFVAHGADENILIDAHPHIGTNKLPEIIVKIRENILASGGEIHFDTRVTDFMLNEKKIISVTAVRNGTEKEFPAKNIILATGHSARDIFELLHRKKILIEAKPFAMGVRVEHPQELIDSLQYRCRVEEVQNLRKYLPPAPYSLVHQVDGKGVYSFCMCPGGIIAPCATAQEEIVTNGWSPSKRNNPFANSGIVVPVDPLELKNENGSAEFSGLNFQRQLERAAWEAGGKTQVAPAQALADFAYGNFSRKLPECSYTPGIISAPLHELLPASIGKRLQEGFREFGKKMKGYLSNEAVVVGVESRTSSPVRIPRDKEKLHHVEITNLFPCGEGAGYAGGIVSAAMDGQKCAEMIAVL
ncbi:MAG: FAD-binding protein [Bacteroidetes bacterium]|nr:FAD-binding protein [Bacteroidota bacterium]